MDVHVEPGKYVLAVSGGVDSMVLLDVLRQQPNLQLVVAHFDHGIRQDAAKDRRLVQDVTARHGLQFRYQQGQLGSGASEAVARQARYAFLEDVRQSTKSQAIITAHHQDDMLETALLNICRGTGRRGLSSLGSRETLKRPLLHLTKEQLRQYAAANGLVWHEDSTNLDTTYRRNYLRHKVMPRFSPQKRQQLHTLIVKTHMLNHEIDASLVAQLQAHSSNKGLDRRWFIGLPHNVSRELLATWLRQAHLAYDSKTLERLVAAAKTAQKDKRMAVSKNYYMHVSKDNLALELAMS
jgi:tRNA(Ile)-lysidine synthase